MKKIIKAILEDKIQNNSIIILDPKVVTQVFTKKRLELIEACREPMNLTSLAKKLGRRKQAVHRDVKYLEGLGIIGIEHQGRNRIPKLLKSAMYYSFSEPARV